MNKQYIQLIADLKQNIIQSRYEGLRLANKEQLILYFKTGKILSEKIDSQKWGAKIIEQIAEDLQKQVPGLRGFSYRNLMNMKRLFTEYQVIIILQSVTAEIRSVRRGPNKNRSLTLTTKESIKKEKNKIRRSPAAQLINVQSQEAFFNISFTHHIVILNKCKTQEERFFYINQAAAQFWSVSVLEHFIESDLFAQQGKLPNNFSKTLPDPLKPSALKVFQDEYLMDFIMADSEDDERRRTCRTIE